MSTPKPALSESHIRLLAVLVDLAAEGLIDMTVAQFVEVATAQNPSRPLRRHWPKLEDAVRSRIAVLNGMAVFTPGEISESNLTRILEWLGADASAALSAFESQKLAPIAVSDEELELITGAPPTTVQQKVASRYSKEMRVIWKLAPQSIVERQLAALRSRSVTSGEEEEEDVRDEIAELAAASPAVQWVDSLIRQAIAERASDIHFTPVREGRWSVSLRIDGELSPRPAPPPQMADEIVKRLIHIAGMDTTKADKVSLDGRIQARFNNRKVDLRVASAPVTVPSRDGTATAPKVVARVLDPVNIEIPLDDMGFAQDTLEALRRHSRKRQGAIIVSGPTGSGKTTTLYALIREVVDPSINVMTVEDPVEYLLPGVSQMQVSRTQAHTLDFAGALRAMLRLDPDVILVGEIRDLETAKTAADAAVTGHLVFSTVHAPSAPEVFVRLVQLEVDPYTVAQAISATTAQRLLRRVCANCVEMRAPTPQEEVFIASVVERFGLEAPTEVASAVGCPNCRGGYRGRAAYCEVLEVDEKVRELITARASAADLEAYAREALGYRTLAEDAWRHVLSGDTTLEEYSRAVDARD